MKFRDSYSNRPHASKEVLSTKSKVETAGYMPAELKITSMINAGMRLNQYRKEQYDTVQPDIDDVEVDPTRHPSFDQTDASVYGQAVTQKLKNDARERLKKPSQVKDKGPDKVQDLKKDEKSKIE